MRNNRISNELQERIILVAYGEASFFEKRRINKIASKDKAVMKMLSEYRETAKKIHTIPKEKFLGEIKAKKELETTKSILEDIYLIFISRPLVTAATTLLLVFAILFSVISDRKISYDGYFFWEVDRARIESKEALLLVSDILNKTGRNVRDNILIDEVSKPINDGINSLNKLFKEK